MAKNLRDYLRDAAHFVTAPPSSGEEKASSPFETKASAARTADFFSRIGVEHYPPRKYRELYPKYNSNPIVRNCLKLCAESVAKLEPIVRIDGKENASAAKAIGAWFKQPNPLQDRFGFVCELASYFKASGNGWVEGVRGGSKDYLEQYALRPERMGIKPGANGWAQEYTYRSQSGTTVRMQGDIPGDTQPGAGQRTWRREGRVIANSTSRLLHVKDFNPSDDLFGAGALEAAEQALGTYENAQTLARRMFENAAMPSGALVYRPQVPSGQAAPPLSKEQREELQNLLDTKFKGAKNVGRPMILSAGLEWQQFAMAFVDMQADLIRNQAARDICLAFGVPPMLLGIPGDNTYSNYQEASRAFYRNTVLSDATRIYGGLANWWGQLTGITGLELHIDEEKIWALAEELEALWMRVESAQSLSFQEKRAALGYDPLPAKGDLMSSPMGGYATLEELIANDYGLFGPRSAQVVGNEPVPADPAALPPPEPKK